MVDVQVGAKHVVDVLEPQARGRESVEPGFLRKVHGRRVTFVLAGAGVDQDRVLGRAHDEGLIGHHHLAGRRIKHFPIKLREMALADFGI